MKVGKKLNSKGVSARGFGPCGKVKNKVKLKVKSADEDTWKS